MSSFALPRFLRLALPLTVLSTFGAAGCAVDANPESTTTDESEITRAPAGPRPASEVLLSGYDEIGTSAAARS